MRTCLAVLFVMLVPLAACSDDNNSNSNNSADAALADDAGDTSGPQYDCAACTTVDCYEGCDAPALSAPETLPTCDGVLRFEDEFEQVYRLEPADFADQFNASGPCSGAEGSSDFVFTFVAPTDGEFTVSIQNLSKPGENLDLLHIGTTNSPANICEDLGGDIGCAGIAQDPPRAVKTLDVQAGDEVAYIMAVEEAADFAISGSYEATGAPGEACEASGDCVALAECQDNVCTCTGGSEQSGRACQCPSGMRPNQDGTACEEGPVNPCDADPYPCAADETCSLDDTGNVVCEPEAPATAGLGESCRNVTCEAGLYCETTTVCPTDSLGPICVTPCSSDSQCSEGDVACSKTSSLASPTCEPVNSISDRSFCNWN